MKLFIRTSFLSVAIAVALCLSSCTQMRFRFSAHGTLTLVRDGKQQISESPVGMVLVNGELHAPVSAKSKASELTLDYGFCQVLLSRQVRPDGSLKLTVVDIPDDVDAFVFGPYICPDVTETGEWLGGAWHADGSLVCIQSLNPKTVGECFHKFENHTSYPSPASQAAGVSDGRTVLSCTSTNMTRPVHWDVAPESGLKNIYSEPVPAPDGEIKGASIILTCAPDGRDMLRQIGQIELEEGLPHPLIEGEWDKTSPHASDLYLIFSGSDMESQVRMAEKAGVHWIYFTNPFKSWGHFEIDRGQYPGGEEEFRRKISSAREHGVNVGFHTLSNFIQTSDSYVTPIPHPDLLAFDSVKLVRSVTAEETELYLEEKLNYDMPLNLRTVRMGDELIRFSSFDAERNCLTGCVRGAFGTAASSHSEGSEVTHLADHGYQTFFPSIRLQGEMASRIGQVMYDNGVRRMSFDGVEGCLYTGHGEYAASEFVRQVYESSHNMLICDASRSSHYRWHAHSYFNWGEPWYDFQRRGGSYHYRVRNQEIFRRNLLPGMLGWYIVTDHTGRYEATVPENLEFMLSRSIAYDAGMCLNICCDESPKMDRYLAIVKEWQEFRFGAQISDELRKLMQGRDSNWHLERSSDGWNLSELEITDFDLGYCDQSIGMETGTGYSAGLDESQCGVMHKSAIVLDRSTGDRNLPYITEPLKFRLRIGNPLQHGTLHGFTIGEGWYGPKTYLRFDVTAYAGEYLVYEGGTVLLHYDCDYNLIETVQGQGEEVLVDGSYITGLSFGYSITGDDSSDGMCMMLKNIRTKRTISVEAK